MICCSETASGNQSLRFPFSPLCGRRPFLSCLSNTLSFLPAASRAQNIFSASGTQLLPEFNWHRTRQRKKRRKRRLRTWTWTKYRVLMANGAPRAYHSGQIGLPKARMDKRRTCKIQTANEAAQGWGGKWTANGCWSTAKKRKKDILKRQNEGIADIDEKRLPMTHPAGSDSAPGARVAKSKKRDKRRAKDVDKIQSANEATQGCGRKCTAHDCWSEAKRNKTTIWGQRTWTKKTASLMTYVGRSTPGAQRAHVFAKGKIQDGARSRPKQTANDAPCGLRLRAGARVCQKQRGTKGGHATWTKDRMPMRQRKDVDENELPTTAGQRQRRTLLKGCWGWLLF